MAKISEYGNYETGKSPTEIENFKDTGIIPVSGSYTGSNDDMTTKSIALSDLAESGLPDTTGHNQGDVLTIGDNGPDWIAPTSGGGGSDIPEIPEDADAKDYVLGIKDGKLAWVQLEVYLGSSEGFFDVDYK